jgi:hypothetical protein
MRHGQNKYEDVQLVQGFFRQQWNFSLPEQSQQLLLDTIASQIIGFSRCFY